MVNIELDGLELDFNEIKEYVINTSLENLLTPLRGGKLPNWIPPKRDSERYYGLLIQQLKQKEGELTVQEKEWYKNLKQFREKLCSFDKSSYDKLKETGKNAHAKLYGSQCAKLLEKLKEGYQPKPGHGQLIDPIEFYNNPMYHTTVKDPKSGIPYTMGLEIKEDEEK